MKTFKNILSGDIFVAAYILTAFVMLIVPLPTWLLDVLLAFDMSLSFTIVFSCMLS